MTDGYAGARFWPETALDPERTLSRLSVFMALYSLGRAFFEALAERGADFV